MDEDMILTPEEENELPEYALENLLKYLEDNQQEDIVLVDSYKSYVNENITKDYEWYIVTKNDYTSLIIYPAPQRENEIPVISKIEMTDSMEWDSYKSIIQEIAIKDRIAFETCYTVFRNYDALEYADLENLVTDEVTSFAMMFENCINLKEVKQNFNTTKSLNFFGMFNNCQSLTQLNLTNFDTTSSQNFMFMFNNCINLRTLLLKFDTRQAYYFDKMFMNCSSLEYIDFGWHFNIIGTSQDIIKNMAQLTQIDPTPETLELSLENPIIDFDGIWIKTDGEVIKTEVKRDGTSATVRITGETIRELNSHQETNEPIIYDIYIWENDDEEPLLVSITDVEYTFENLKDQSYYMIIVARLSNGHNFTGIGSIQAPFSLAENAYSLGEQLVVNGDGILKNNSNFSKFQFTALESYNMSAGSFKATEAGQYETDYAFPILANNSYQLEIDGKTVYDPSKEEYIDEEETQKKEIQNNVRITFYDYDKVRIDEKDYSFIPGTTVKLNSPLKVGDTIIEVDGFTEAWKTQDLNENQKGIIVWDYENAAGYKYPEEIYSKLHYDNIFTDGSIFIDNAVAETQIIPEEEPAPPPVTEDTDDIETPIEYVADTENILSYALYSSEKTSNWKKAYDKYTGTHTITILQPTDDEEAEYDLPLYDVINLDKELVQEDAESRTYYFSVFDLTPHTEEIEEEIVPIETIYDNYRFFLEIENKEPIILDKNNTKQSFVLNKGDVIKSIYLDGGQFDIESELFTESYIKDFVFKLQLAPADLEEWKPSPDDFTIVYGGENIASYELFGEIDSDKIRYNKKSGIWTVCLNNVEDIEGNVQDEIKLLNFKKNPLVTINNERYYDKQDFILNRIDNNIKDTYDDNGTITRNVGVIKLSSISFFSTAGGMSVVRGLIPKTIKTNSIIDNPQYTKIENFNGDYMSMPNKSYGIVPATSSSGIIYFRDTEINNNLAKFRLAIADTSLYYELPEPYEEYIEVRDDDVENKKYILDITGTLLNTDLIDFVITTSQGERTLPLTFVDNMPDFEGEPTEEGGEDITSEPLKLNHYYSEFVLQDGEEFIDLKLKVKDTTVTYNTRFLISIYNNYDLENLDNWLCNKNDKPNIECGLDIKNNFIILNEPWDGEEFEVGTSLSQHDLIDDSVYRVCDNEIFGENDWKHFTGTVIQKGDGSSGGVLPKAAVFGKVSFDLNTQNVSGVTQFITNVSVRTDYAQDLKTLIEEIENPLISIEKVYYLDTQGKTIEALAEALEAQETLTATGEANIWSLIEPTWTTDCYKNKQRIGKYYTCTMYRYGDGSIKYSDVVEDPSLSPAKLIAEINAEGEVASIKGTIIDVLTTDQGGLQVHSAAQNGEAQASYIKINGNTLQGFNNEGKQYFELAEEGFSFGIKEEDKIELPNKIATKQDINNIHIGGRNLLKNTNDLIKWNLTDEAAWGIVDVLVEKEENEENEENEEEYHTVTKEELGYFNKNCILVPSYSRDNVPLRFSSYPNIEYALIKDKEITLSFDVRLKSEWNNNGYIFISFRRTDTEEAKSWHSRFYLDSDKIEEKLSNAQDWIQIFYTFTITDDLFTSGTTQENDNWLNIEFSVSNKIDVEIRNIQLELGNTVSAWSLAPEDYLNSISDTQDSISEYMSNNSFVSTDDFISYQEEEKNLKEQQRIDNEEYIEKQLETYLKTKSPNEKTNVQINDNGILLTTQNTTNEKAQIFQIRMTGDGIYLGSKSPNGDDINKDSCVAYIDKDKLVINETVNFDQSKIGAWTLDDNIVNGQSHLTIKYLGVKKEE